MPGTVLSSHFSPHTNFDTTVVSVEPETEWKGDSCVNAITVTAGVDVSHSGQGNEAPELDGDRQECVFCVCFLC